jgi:hypothetical protein
MMQSSDPSEPLDLERGLPTSPEDVAVLWRSKGRHIETHDFLAFLARLPAPSYEALRARTGPRGAPFTLEG